MKIQKDIKRLLGIELGKLRQSLNLEIVGQTGLTPQQIKFMERGHTRGWLPYGKLLNYYRKAIKIELVDVEGEPLYREGQSNKNSSEDTSPTPDEKKDDNF